MILLVPADAIHPARPDEHFAAEAKAAAAAGMETALVDHDALARPDRADEAVRRVRATGTAVYRGWMLRSERYAAFDAALRRRGVTLRTGAEQYRRAHELPGWYGELAALTPRSVWTATPARDRFEQALGELGPGPAVLRDYTKSLKHHWHEAVYLPETADLGNAWRVASRFLELRGAEMTGGFVVRRFENFVSAEIRTWWVDGVCRLIGPHPDTPDELPDTGFDPGFLAPALAGLALPFITVDLALRADGVWRVVEVGDGQVSDRPRTIGAETLLTCQNNPS